jgi:hypothetical protein
MSLLQQIVDTIGDSMSVFEEQPNNDPPKPQNSETEVRPRKENRDDASFEEKKDASSEDKKDSSSTIISTEQQKKDAMVEITNLIQVYDGELPEKTETHSGGSDSASNSSVSFGSVQVREYERVIDSTNIYMGLALGWNYNDRNGAPVRERNHASKYSVSSSKGGDERMKRTNGSDRYGMLIRYGYAQKELKQATKEAAVFYKQRQREAARSIVVADERNKQTPNNKPKRRPLLRSMFG